MPDSDRQNAAVDRSELPDWFTTVMTRAVSSEEHTVEIIPGKNDRWNIAIDGEPLFENGGRSDWELFSWPDYDAWLSDDGAEKVVEVFEDA